MPHTLAPPTAQANVPIVPISLVGSYDVYPRTAILPLRPSSDLAVYVHPPIQPEGKARGRARDAANSEIHHRLLPSRLLGRPHPGRISAASRPYLADGGRARDAHTRGDRLKVAARVTSDHLLSTS